MKKSKNKFLNSHKIDWNFEELLKDLPSDYYKDIDYNNYDKAYINTTEKEIIQGFLYREGNKLLVIPEPEPSLMFISNAENKINQLIIARKKVMDTSNKNTSTIEQRENFSNFFNIAFDFTINLFSSIESFNNSVIPESYSFRNKRKVYDREKIQRFIDFKTKTEVIIPEIFKKSFMNSFPKAYKSILNLKSIRDNLIHSKNQSKNWEASYRNIYRNILNLNPLNSYTNTVEYMNFYKEDCVKNSTS